MIRKGIILAGGSGTRLYPATKVISKQLLPVFDKPMIYYPLTTLMLANVRELLVISTPQDTSQFRDLMGDGSQWGLNIEYAVQPSPGGLAQSLIIAERFLNGAPSILILGDNIFYGNSLREKLMAASSRVIGATIFVYHVDNPKQYGVAEFDREGKVISLEEKPENPKSNYAVTGLYFYDHKAVEYAKQIKPSYRGELEITDLNRIYLKQKALSVQHIGRGFAWLDTGTQESLVNAHQFVHAIECRQGLKIACPEEVAFRQNLIDRYQLKELAQPIIDTSYGQYLMQIIEELPYEDN